MTAPATSGCRRGIWCSTCSAGAITPSFRLRRCIRLDAPLPDPLGYLGYLGHGWTAYAALTRGVQIQAGDTVFISSAAGAIGSMAGQIARLLGAGRVIGSTSASAKADRLVAELGYDAAVIRGADRPFVAQLREAAPTASMSFSTMSAVSSCRPPRPSRATTPASSSRGHCQGSLPRLEPGGSAPVVLDSTQILLRKITIRGYSADDDNPEARDEWFGRLADWCRSATSPLPHVVIDGLEQATLALADYRSGPLLWYRRYQALMASSG